MGFAIHVDVRVDSRVQALYRGQVRAHHSLRVERAGANHSNYLSREEPPCIAIAHG